MSTYAAEPVPKSVEEVTSSYLDRQFNAIQQAFMAGFMVPRSSILPNRVIPGALIYIENAKDSSINGFYGCVKNSSGEGEWKKIV
jgi:hypothetical protein